VRVFDYHVIELPGDRQHHGMAVKHVDIGQRPPAPEPDCPAVSVTGGTEVTSRARGPRGFDRLTEREQVKLAGAGPQAVAGSHRRERHRDTRMCLAAAKHPPEPAQVGLDQAHRRRGRTIGPQGVDDRFPVHERVGPRDQQAEDRALLGPA